MDMSVTSNFFSGGFSVTFLDDLSFWFVILSDALSDVLRRDDEDTDGLSRDGDLLLFLLIVGFWELMLPASFLMLICILTSLL